MDDRYWEGHKDGGNDMREKCRRWEAINESKREHIQRLLSKLDKLQNEPTYRMRQELQEQVDGLLSRLGTILNVCNTRDQDVSPADKVAMIRDQASVVEDQK